MGVIQRQEAKTSVPRGFQAGATGGEPWQELVVKLTHIGAALGLIAAWALLLTNVKNADGTAHLIEDAKAAQG